MICCGTSNGNGASNGRDVERGTAGQGNLLKRSAAPDAGEQGKNGLRKREREREHVYVCVCLYLCMFVFSLYVCLCVCEGIWRNSEAWKGL